ncbi:undecaprenyl-diphosphate phosphatase [Alphaproteobacteria bacterium GH1-50]|uniref:Undecaprenyl-diphosphatase n=1 Tax=Kangsaoukella pontilimi TaxID=2691042 RepID=A0A7C9MWJ9_9RHOB|nr:undecaprenyl-diphosphate phosphatase [Kangsaoukella pontilimi]MXQ08420.1 undecaprenyl-diphosphate phosphatase [Kangsaoukella pontilimi]
MPLLHLILVALVQGITEFLPISSSGHLILLPALTGLQDQGQVIDVAVHVGTLGAVMLYFRAETVRLFRGAPKLFRGRIEDQDSWLALCLFIATVPVVLAGLILHLTGFDALMRSVEIIGWSTLIFGFVLFWTDRRGETEKSAEGWSLRDALVMGLWQMLALVPGTSRSGVTISAGRILGYQRADAAKLAMLMSIPTIMASGVLVGADAVAHLNGPALGEAAIAAAFAFLAALGALAFMMRLLRSVSFTPYVIYRVFLGIALLIYAYA